MILQILFSGFFYFSFDGFELKFLFINQINI